jgi:pilus assembly protein FimV
MPAPAREEAVDDPFDLAFDAPAASAPAAAPAPADDPSMDFSLDLPEDTAKPAERLPSASTDPLDMDIMGFDIPEVPALTEPPKVDPTAMDFDEPLELPEDAESITAAPAPAREFDLSDINLDLDNEFTGAAPGAGAGAAAGAGEPAAAPGRDDTLSAHHMEMDTKLDLAIAYQEIGDKEGARELLDEVLRGGSDDQIAKANAMKAQLG